MSEAKQQSKQEDTLLTTDSNDLPSLVETEEKEVEVDVDVGVDADVGVCVGEGVGEVLVSQLVQ